MDSRSFVPKMAGSRRVSPETADSRANRAPPAVSPSHRRMRPKSPGPVPRGRGHPTDALPWREAMPLAGGPLLASRVFRDDPDGKIESGNGKSKNQR